MIICSYKNIDIYIYVYLIYVYIVALLQAKKEMETFKGKVAEAEKLTNQSYQELFKQVTALQVENNKKYKKWVAGKHLALSTDLCIAGKGREQTYKRQKGKRKKCVGWVGGMLQHCRSA